MAERQSEVELWTPELTRRPERYFFPEVKFND